MAQKRVHKAKSVPPRPKASIPDSKIKSTKGDDLKADMDEILEDIDKVLESNAEEFVKAYTQRGGE